MNAFWQLISVFVSLAGFLLVAGVALARGESLFSAVLRAVIVFAALWAAQSLLRAILGLSTDRTRGGQ